MNIKFLGIKFKFTKQSYKKPYKMVRYLLKNLTNRFIYDCVNILRQKQLIPPPQFKLAINVIAKNEAPYIIEWIEFHRLVGVEKFYLYDNNSNDNLKELLKPYIESRLVEYTFFPGEKIQLPAYNDCIKKHKFDCEYIAFVDCDEFIVPVKYNTITEFLDSLEKKLNKKPDAVGINWLLHGYNGHYNKQNGLITEIYKKCDYNAGENQNIKSIYNPLSIVDVICAHYASLIFGTTAVNSNGENIKYHFNKPFCFDEIRINHYYTKSYEEFMERIKKGKPNGDEFIFNEPFNPNYLSVDNDCLMEKYLPLLKQRIEKFNCNSDI